MANWFLFRRNVPHGPYSEEQIRDWIRSGQIRPDEKLNRQGAPNWLSVDMIPEFAPLVSRPRPASTRQVRLTDPGTQQDPWQRRRGWQEWLAEAWRLVSANLGQAVTVALPLFLPVLLTGLALGWGLITLTLEAFGGDYQGILGALFGGDYQGFLGALFGIPVVLVTMGLSALIAPILTYGASACLWEMVEGRRLHSGALLSGFGRTITILLWWLPLGLVSIVMGILAYLIPGLGLLGAVIVGVFLDAIGALGLFSLLTTNSGVIAAYRHAWLLARSDPLNVAILALLLRVIGGVVGRLCCVGFLIGFPFTMTAYGCCYRDLSLLPDDQSPR